VHGGQLPGHGLVSVHVSSVVVRNFNLYGAFRGRFEAHPELVINPDGVLSSPITFQGFKTVAGRGSKILQLRRGVEIAKFPAGDFENI